MHDHAARRRRGRRWVGRFGAIGLVAREIPSPLALLALVELTTTDDEDEVSPPIDGYADVTLTFYGSPGLSSRVDA